MALDAVMELLQVAGSYLTKILGSKLESHSTATSAPKYQGIFQALLPFCFKGIGYVFPFCCLFLDKIMVSNENCW